MTAGATVLVSFWDPKAWYQVAGELENFVLGETPLEVAHSFSVQVGLKVWRPRKRMVISPLVRHYYSVEEVVVDYFLKHPIPG